jgi:hypothetical protein
MNLRARTQIRTLRKQNQILQLKYSLHNIIRIPLHLNLPPIIRHNHRLTIHKIPHTSENQVRIGTRNLQLLRQRIEIPANLLEIQGWHMDNGCERNIGKLNVLHIRIKQLHHPRIRRSLVRILRTNPQLIRIGCRKEQRKAIRIIQGLNKLEQVNHIDSKDVLGRAVKVFKPIRMKPEVREYGMGFIHVNHLNASAVKFQIGFRQDFLQGFNQGAKGSRLYRPDFKEIPIGIRLLRPCFLFRDETH